MDDIKRSKEKVRCGMLIGLLFVLCALVLLCQPFSSNASYAAETSYSTPSDAQASGTSGGCSWYITSATDASNPGQLVIYPTDGTSGTLEETTGYSSGSPWSDYATIPESIYIAEGVTTGTEARYLFSRFTNIKTADVGNLNFDSSTKQIDGMFYNCSSLQSVNTTGWDLSTVTSLGSMFYGCSSLSSIDMSQWDTSKVTYLSHLFNGCSSLTSVDLTPLEMGKVETIASMFCNCKNLQSITGLSGRDMPNLTSLNTLFSRCSSLTSVDVTGLNTENVGVFDDTFAECTNLKSIVGLNTWNTSSSTHFYGMFNECTSLESVDVSSFSTGNCTNFEIMFYKCTSLTTLDLSNFDTSKATKMTNMFKDMSRLQQVTLGEKFSFTGNGSASCVLPTPDSFYIAGATGKWQAIGSGTVDAPAGTVYLPADVPSNVAETYVVEKPKAPVLAARDTWYQGTTDKASITTINIVNSYTSDGRETESWDASEAQDGSVTAFISADSATLTIAGNGYGCIYANADSTNAFKDFITITAFNGAELLDTSNAVKLAAVFRGCEKMVTLDVSNWKTSSCTDMSDMFYWCKALAQLDVSNFDTSNVVYMDDMFGGCGTLTELDVSGFNTSKCKNMARMFYSCSELPVLDVSGFDTSVCTNMTFMFAYMSVRELNVSNFNTSNVTNMSYMFCGSAIETVDVSGFDTSKNQDFTAMFKWCGSLLNLQVNDFKLTGSGSISCEQMFLGCSSLTSLDLSNWDTSNVTSLKETFTYCDGITQFDLSNFNTSKVTTFYGCFRDCENLAVLNISSWDTSAVTDSANIKGMFDDCIRLRQVTLGTDYSFNGGTDTRGCNLPTPDPAYIDGATGKWQAVDAANGGTVDNAIGTVYLPADVPNNVAETYVIEKQKVPVLAEQNTWYKSSTDKSTFTTINIVDSYTPDGAETESWDASDAQDGSVMAYIGTDGTTLTIAGNGYGCIYANANSKRVFQSFYKATAINGTALIDTSNMTDGSYMFASCNALQSLDVSSWNVSNTTTIECMFSGLSSLTSFGANQLSNWEVDKVETIKGLFSSCEIITSIDVSKWVLSSCKSTEDAFLNCFALSTLDVSKWDVSQVENMHATFYACESLKTIDVSKWVTSKATDMSSLFENCSALENLDVSKFNTQKVITFDSMFAYCKVLEIIDVSGFVTSQAEDMGMMFWACNSLKALDLSNFNTASCYDFNLMFAECYTLPELDVTSFTLRTDRTIYIDGMFRNCANLTALDLSKFNTSMSESFTQLFKGCSSLKILDLSNFDTSKVTNFNSVFNGCKSLEVLNIGSWNTSSAEKMNDAFKDCITLHQVTLSADFSFYGSGSTRLCVLPTPDPTYIPGATGKWQAVADGTVDAPAGAIYDPVDMPNNVAETYVMPNATLSIDVPIQVIIGMKATGEWTTPTATKNTLINYSALPARVTSATTQATSGFTLCSATEATSSTDNNVFGGTITAGSGTAQDLSSIDTSGDTWTMAAGSASDESNLISLQLTGNLTNVEHHYFVYPIQVFDMQYAFELVL